MKNFILLLGIVLTISLTACLNLTESGEKNQAALNKATTHYWEKKYSDGIVALEGISKETYNSLLLRGRLLLELNSFQESIASLEKALAMSTSELDSAAVQLDLFEAYLYSGETLKAEAIAERAVYGAGISHQEDWLKYYMTRVRIQERDYVEALKMSKELLTLEKSSIPIEEIRENVIACLAALKKDEEYCLAIGDSKENRDSLQIGSIWIKTPSCR